MQFVLKEDEDITEAASATEAAATTATEAAAATATLT